jgi:hypothetical protein
MTSMRRLHVSRATVEVARRSPLKEMSMRRQMGTIPWLVGIAIALCAAPVVAQVFVYPQRPSQSQVRYEQFDWHWVDIRRAEGARGEPSWQSGPRLHNLGLDAVTEPAGWTLSPVATGASAYDQLAGARGAGRPRGPLAAEARGAGPDRVGSGAIGDAAASLRPPEPPRPDFVEGGGVRLYFYEREREIAERAAAAIAEGYDYLAQEFGFVTPRTFPYFLYSSYHDFLQTNLFPVQEGVLGVTATRGALEMTLPYFGDHQLFDHISIHELAHQFTIQKVRTRAREMKAHGDPLMRIPLWFIEGIAEYYALGGLDDETAMLVRDLALNPDPMKGYALLNFFEDRLRGYLWTYKLGQARVAFLEEVYGEGTIQKVLDESPRLVSLPESEQRVGSFPELLARITGDHPAVIHRRFESWLKQKSYEVFLSAPHRPETLDTLGEGIEAQAIAASPDGTVVMYRTIHPDTRRSELRVVDPRRPDQTVRVVRDGVPNLESLHPIGGRNIAVGESALAFVARRQGRDVIYWQDYEREAERTTERVTPDPGTSLLTQTQLDRELRRRGMTMERDVWRVRFKLGSRESFVISDPDIVAVDEIALSPEGDRLAFIGLSRAGQKDVFVLHRESGEVQQLTDDVFAERGITWGEQGIIYSSDATDERYFNLFLIPEIGAEPQRLTSERRDHIDPVALPGGRTLFVAYGATGANLYEVHEGRAVRRTGTSTGMFAPAPAPGGVWVLHHFQGRRRIARMPEAQMIEEPRPRVANHGPPEPLAAMGLDEAVEYDPFSLSSWGLGPVFGVFGASAEGIYGQGIAVATDRLRDHMMVLQLQAFGSFDLIDGDLFYTNARHRVLWGGGLFQDVSFRIDQTFEEDDGLLFFSAERFSGARTIFRFPFDRYRFIQAGLAGGVVGRFLTRDTRRVFEEPADPRNPTGRDLASEWDETHRGLAMRGEASLSLGYNTLRFHPATGPIAGGSALATGTVATEPGGIGNFSRARLDAEYYIPISGAANIAFRSGIGQIFGSDEARNFFLSSLDTLRAVPFGDTSVLLGRSFGFSTLELRLPLSPIVRLAFIDVEGIAGLDFGGVGDTPQDLWDRRILNGVTGFNFGIGWIVFRLHFARPFDIGGIVPNDGNWNVNFSLGYRYM